MQPLLAVIHGRIHCHPEKRSNRRGRRGTHRCQEGRGAHVPYSFAAPQPPLPHPRELVQKREPVPDPATADPFLASPGWWSPRSSPCFLLLRHLALVGPRDGWIPATGGGVSRDAQSGVCVCVCVWRCGAKEGGGQEMIRAGCARPRGEFHRS
jgi:hypothetical protein